MRKTYSLRITTFIGLSHFLIGIIGVGIVANAALYAIFRSGETALIRESEDMAYVIAGMLERIIPQEQTLGQSFDAQTIAEIQDNVRVHLVRRADVGYRLYDNAGAVVLTNAAYEVASGLMPVDHLKQPEIQKALAMDAGYTIRAGVDGQLQMYVATILRRERDVYAILQLQIPYFANMTPTFTTMTIVGGVGILIVFAIMLVGWKSSIYLSEPVVNLSRVAEQLSSGNLNARAEPKGPREVIHLAETLNSLAAQVQDSLATMQAFVANASHELRTPLTGIKLQVGVLRSGAMEEPEVAERFLSQIECEIDRLSLLVNDLLDLSQLESGGLGNAEPVNLNELAREVLSFWEVRLNQAGLAMSLEAGPTPPVVSGDPYRLRHLLDNLVDNAIKNTPPGGKVQLLLTAGHTPGTVRLEVRDTGVGIAREHHHRIFDRFYRVESGRAPLASGSARAGQPCGDQPTGSGLGLAIARTIVLAHRGKIGVNSAVGEGSVFWVELPEANFFSREA